MATTKGRSPAKRGFAAMGEEKKREIAAKGGQSVPAEERSFSKDHELASESRQQGREGRIARTACEGRSREP